VRSDFAERVSSRAVPYSSLRLCSVLAALGALVVSEGQPQCQPAPPPDVNKGDAKELMQLGVKLLKSQDYLGALAVFKDAHKRFPSAKILLNIGTTLRLLERNAEATNVYQQYLDSPDADPARVPEVTAEIARLDKSLAILEITITENAEFQVGDGDWYPATRGKKFRVVPGPYTIRARLDGFKPYESHNEAALGATTAVSVVLEANPLPEGKPVFITVPGDGPGGAPEDPRSRLAAIAIGHFDITGGAAIFVGATFDVTERIQVRGTGIIGANLGGFIGGSFAFLTGALRPNISAGLPIFINDGPRVGLRGAAGLEIVANRHFSLLLEVGVEYLLNPQDQVEFSGMLRSINSVAFIPALGITGRL